MVMRTLIVAAAVVYLGIVLACVPRTARTDAGPEPVPLRLEPLAGLPFRGVVVQVQRTDWIDRYKATIDRIAAVGADTVSIVVDARQENGASGRIYLDLRSTPTVEQLGDLLRHAKRKNLRVVLMPIVLLDNPRGNEWRGTLKPASWEEWFDSYRAMIIHFAEIAQNNSVDVFVVGSELVSSESKAAEWDRTIDAIRRIFRGYLTYSSNWDHYANIPFWHKLDLVGMNSYWKLGDNHNVTVEQIRGNWTRIQQELFAFLRRVEKPLLFLEVGWCSIQNAAHEPWDYTRDEVPIDFDLQRKLYEGFFQSWHGNPNLGGFMVWEFLPEYDGDEHRRRVQRGYTPEGKPAEKVLREWFARPWKP